MGEDMIEVIAKHKNISYFKDGSHGAGLETIDFQTPSQQLLC